VALAAGLALAALLLRLPGPTPDEGLAVLRDESRQLEQRLSTGALVHSSATLATELELQRVEAALQQPEIVTAAARDLAPHLVAFYLRDLAAELHSYYNATRLLADEEPVKHARLKLVLAVRQVLATGLALLGVSAPEKM